MPSSVRAVLPADRVGERSQRPSFGPSPPPTQPPGDSPFSQRWWWVFREVLNRRAGGTGDIALAFANCTHSNTQNACQEHKGRNKPCHKEHEIWKSRGSQRVREGNKMPGEAFIATVGTWSWPYTFETTMHRKLLSTSMPSDG